VQLRGWSWFTTLVVLAVTPGACKRPAPPGPGQRVVARVGSGVITTEQLEEQLRGLPFPERTAPTPEARRKALEELVRVEVATQEARRRGYDRDPQLVRFMNQQLVARLMREEVDTKITAGRVPDADVERFYTQHADDFRRPQEMRVSQILVKDEAKAQKIAAELRAAKGDAAARQKRFSELVTRHSEDEPSRARGGDLGVFDQKTRVHPPEVVAAAFALKEVGDVSPVVKSPAGHHILQLTLIRPAVVRTLVEVKPLIQQRLARTLRAERADALMADLRKNIKVEIDEEALRQAKAAPPPTAPK
jgi:parvulin-like peptidyl-prolyl isomerase